MANAAALVMVLGTRNQPNKWVEYNVTEGFFLNIFAIFDYFLPFAFGMLRFKKSSNMAKILKKY